MDLPQQQSTVAPTDGSQGQQAPVTLTGSQQAQQSSVNPAQTLPPSPPVQSQQQQQQQAVDISATINNYEGRIRTLMSDKDKALNERDKAIATQVTLQQQLTALQEQMASNMNASATSTQQALDELARTKNELAQVQAQYTRLQALKAHPHLIDYEEFLPVTTDADKMTEAVGKLKAMWERDHQKAFPQQQVSQQGQQQGQQAAQSPYANASGLYGHRPNVPLSLTQAPAPVAGSTPAMMNPAGAISNAEAIDSMLKSAMNSGNPQDFLDAVEKAKLAATQQVNAALGRM